MSTATGTFEARFEPPAEQGGFGLMQGTKTWAGDMAGTSLVTMLSFMTDVEGSAAYVAPERLDVTLAERSGTFVVHQRGLMERGQDSLEVGIVPDSGTGELAGIAGGYVIDIRADGTHRYTLTYTLP